MTGRTICFSIRGFDHSVDAVGKIIGRLPTSAGLKGQPVKLGLSQTLKRSYVGYARTFGSDDLWDNVILDLIESLGGAVHLSAAVKELKPEFVQIDITSPVRNSEEQEDRYISSEVLRVVADLGADLGFGFV